VEIDSELGFRGLAIGCFYLLAGGAFAEFPFSRVSAPSALVRIVRGIQGLLRSGDQGVFPIEVGWRQWKYAVVPVLEDPAWAVKIPVNSARLLQNRIAEYISLLESALIQSYRAAGFLPSEES
jgi:hypothetical protein